METDFPIFVAEDFVFGPIRHYSAVMEAFWKLHEPVVLAWCDEMSVVGDPWWQSAKHAAYCLVSHREGEMEDAGEEPHWRNFNVELFLFHDLSEGGTVGFYGSVPIFFDQLLEAIERFTRAGIIDPELSTQWLAEMQAAKPRFLDYYSGWDD